VNGYLTEEMLIVFCSEYNAILINFQPEIRHATIKDNSDRILWIEDLPDYPHARKIVTKIPYLDKYIRDVK